MSDLNTATIVGRLVRDPELKTTTSGKSVSTISVAVGSKYKDVEEVSYIDVELWGKVADLVGKYCKKGKQDWSVWPSEATAMERQRWRKSSTVDYRGGCGPVSWIKG